jgi:hypothetical protein
MLYFLSGKPKIIADYLWRIKIKYTFAHAWRDGRVVDCGGLENRCTERYRGFESLSLRTYGCSSVGRALVSKTRCRAFESLLPCKSLNILILRLLHFL